MENRYLIYFNHEDRVLVNECFFSDTGSLYGSSWIKGCKLVVVSVLHLLQMQKTCHCLIIEM